MTDIYLAEHDANDCVAARYLVYSVHHTGLAAHQQQRRGDAEVGDEEGDAMESTDVAVEEEEGAPLVYTLSLNE
jgi:hypothetical protein